MRLRAQGSGLRAQGREKDNKEYERAVSVEGIA